MQTAVTTGGRVRGAGLAAALRVPAAALLAAVIALAPALLPDSAYADDASAKSPYDLDTSEQLEQGTLVQPGLIETEDGQYAYADSLTDAKDEPVTRVATVVGNVEKLSGGFKGGWGTVTYTWETCEGDGVLALLERGAAADPYLNWQLVSTANVKGQGLQTMNTTTRVGGRSQTLNLQAMNPGYSAWKLTASDELGFSKSTWWVMDVAGKAAAAVGADTTPKSSTDATSETLVNLITKDVADKVETTPVVKPTQPVQETNNTNVGTSQPSKGSLPQTGDAILRIALIALAALAGAAAVALIAAWLLSRRAARREALDEARRAEARRAEALRKKARRAAGRA